MEALIAHLLGDYFFQSDWMAINKTKRTWICIVHAAIYTMTFLVFMLIGQLPLSYKALLSIGVSHFIIDRVYPARYICFIKNFMAPRSWWPVWKECWMTGYKIGDHSQDPTSKPAFLAVWLMIIVDNSLHIIINWYSIKFF